MTVKTKTKPTPEQLAKLASQIAANILAGNLTAYNIVNRELTTLAESYVIRAKAPTNEATSRRVARIAAKVMKGDITRETITTADLKAMAASCLTQSPSPPKGAR